MNDGGKFGEDDPSLAAFYSVYGLIRFDPKAVALALRNGTLTSMEAHGLANLLEGTHPQGLTLKMMGQGRGWKPAAETAARYDRLMMIGTFLERSLLAGNKMENAVIDAASEFGISEPTVYRDFQMYRSIEDERTP